ncbi:hypothetical protein CW306_05695 [Bacillus sp. BA3]|nr:hypothetical protein CW306_05695 [Bacillus sp. BA3]
MVVEFDKYKEIPLQLTKHVFIRQRKWNSYVICMRGNPRWNSLWTAFLQMVALLGTFRSICDGMDDGNQAKKGNVMQMSNLPLKHEKGGPV